MLTNTKHFMNECYRVLKPDGILNMLNFDAFRFSSLFFQDPEHKKGFTRETYKYFVYDTSYYKNFGSIYGYKPWELIKIKEEGSCLRVKMSPHK